MLLMQKDGYCYTESGRTDNRWTEKSAQTLSNQENSTKVNPDRLIEQTEDSAVDQYDKNVTIDISLIKSPAANR